jgi:hypothetical protein
LKALKAVDVSMNMLQAAYMHLGKVKSLCLSKHLYHESMWKSGSIAPCILILGTTAWRRVVSFTPCPLYPWGELLVSIG